MLGWKLMDGNWGVCDDASEMGSCDTLQVSKTTITT
jgi:hypothetical protein